jgi:hypothetical protein
MSLLWCALCYNTFALHCEGFSSAKRVSQSFLLLCYGEHLCLVCLALS